MFKRKYPDPTKNLTCGEFEFDNWIVSDFVLRRLVPLVGIRPYPLNELCLMVGAVTVLKPTHIFEWGTYIGKSARIFYEITRSFELEAEIHSTDLPDDVDHVEHPRRNRGKLVKHIKKVSLYQGDGLEKTLEIYRNIEGYCKPFVFIDGDHEYASVKRELSAIINGMPHVGILLHDTFYQSTESGYNVGPNEAINAVLSLTNHQYKKISTNTGLPGMTLLYQPSGEAALRSEHGSSRDASS